MTELNNIFSEAKKASFQLSTASTAQKNDILSAVAKAITEDMKTILSGYSEKNGNMVGLIIANNDEMALGAIAALNEAGYNKEGARTIPVFGIDATDAAKEKINIGAMTGTIKQDAEGMANTITTIARNFINGADRFMGIDKENAVGSWRVNIPYSPYTKEEK